MTDSRKVGGAIQMEPVVLQPFRHFQKLPHVPEDVAAEVRVGPVKAIALRISVILKPDKKLEKLFIAQGASGFYETA